MTAKLTPGAEAVKQFGWLRAHKYLILRRLVQSGVLALFLIGPWFGIWIVKGNISSSITLDVVPLTDPFLSLQILLSGQTLQQNAIVGSLIVLVFYLLFAGRVYCSWVCPINVVTDSASWLRLKLNIKGGASWSRHYRYGLMAAVLFLALFSGTLAYELINPVTAVYRGLVFGMGLAWFMVLSIFLLDLLVKRHAWCGHLCPVGAFYAVLGEGALLRVRAGNRDQCNDCMDCFAVCPESRVIRAPLKGAAKGISPVINSGLCSNCGRCIDVCAKKVFTFSTRLNRSIPEKNGIQNSREVSS